MKKNLVLKEDIINALGNIGVKKGDTLIVHCSLSKLGYVCGGAQTVIEALLECVGSDGNVVMPTQSWRNLDPEKGVHWEVDELYWDEIRKNWPAYDKNITPSNNMGCVAEMFRTWPQVLRSDHPARSFAAWGKDAEYIVSNHDLSNIFGQDSPLHKIYKLKGYVLLIGVGYDKCTSLHLSENFADIRKEYSIEHSAILKNGKRQWVEYKTLDVDDSDFNRLGESFEQEHMVGCEVIGDAKIRYINQTELVDFATNWFEKNRM